MYQIPNGIKITNAQERNIRKLSDYALNLPEDYKHFDMALYCKSSDVVSPQPRDAKGIMGATCSTNECGTAGCLLGHGPIAGIKPAEGDNWTIYALNRFGMDYWASMEWEWCFGTSWPNNASDGALRLLYLLDYGIPKRFLNRCNEKYYTRKVRKAYVIT